MAYLPLANILHHKLRSVLSAFGIAIGVCTLITLNGLAHGWLDEVADRWDSVDADLIVSSRLDDITTLSGIGLSDKYADIMLDKHGDLISRVVLVFRDSLELGGQSQMVIGVDPDQWHTLTGGRKLARGRLFDPDKRFTNWLDKALTQQADSADMDEIDLADQWASGLEIIIDDRLAKTGGYKLNQTVEAANHRWTIVGIVPEGGLARVFMPRRTAQYLFGGGVVTKSTLMFVKLKDGVDANEAARLIKGIKPRWIEVMKLTQYRSALQQRFGIMFLYVDTVNMIALAIAFLFIMITLYTMVLQRTREISILKSCGASRRFILRQILAESALLTGGGVVAGVVLSFGAARLIAHAKPLMTVTITGDLIAYAVAVAAVGAVLAAIYPAWQAMKVDMVEALTLE